MAVETATNYIKKTEASGYDDILTTAAAGTTYETQENAKAKLTEAKDYVDTELGKLDLTEVTAGQGTIIGAISQTDGLISVSTRELTADDIPVLAQSKITGLEAALNAKANDADLAAIAKSGSTDDLIQGTDTLVFNCGGANA